MLFLEKQYEGKKKIFVGVVRTMRLESRNEDASFKRKGRTDSIFICSRGNLPSFFSFA